MLPSVVRINRGEFHDGRLGKKVADLEQIADHGGTGGIPHDIPSNYADRNDEEHSATSGSSEQSASGILSVGSIGDLCRLRGHGIRGFHDLEPPRRDHRCGHECRHPQYGAHMGPEPAGGYDRGGGFIPVRRAKSASARPTKST